MGDPFPKEAEDRSALCEVLVDTNIRSSSPRHCWQIIVDVFREMAHESSTASRPTLKEVRDVWKLLK